MVVITDFLSNYLEIGTQRKLLWASFYIVTGALIYTHLCSLIGIVVLGLILWYAYDYIEDSTALSIDPSGKYVFITGCDSGFGLDSAKAIRDQGFYVIAGCYDENSEGAKELKGLPWVKKVEVISLDVTSDASVRAAVTEVKDICRDQGLWAVINNAGQNFRGPAELVPMTSYHRTSEVNLFGAIRVIKYCLPLIRQAEGRIVNVTSERAFNHWANSTLYCLTKAGLEAFSNCLRTEMMEHKVKVITVAPGQFGSSTGICVQKLNEAMRDIVVSEHATLSLQDQEKTYPLKRVNDIYKSQEIVAIAKKSGVPSTDPVIKAYLNAITRENPKQCYLVHGTSRQFLDPFIVMARLRPFLPNSIVPTVENMLFRIL